MPPDKIQLFLPHDATHSAVMPQ